MEGRQEHGKKVEPGMKKLKVGTADCGSTNICAW